MIQFNLLPDVKLEYIKANYRKRLVIGASILISGAFLAIFIMLFLLVRVQQKQEIKAINQDIKQVSEDLKKVPDLDKILTIQNQLSSLPDLHDKKVISSRLFDYLSQLTPAQATISNVDVDFDAKTLSIKGNADELSTVNKFADTLKFTTFKTQPSESGDQAKEGKAFSNVVLGSFSVAAPATSGGSTTGNNAAYELTFAFDPIIFENIKTENPNTDPANPVQAVSLTVPKIITTRSELQKPTNLFVPQPTPLNPQDR